MIINKKFWRAYLLPFAILIFFLGCSKDNGTDPESPSEIIPIELNFEDPPFELQRSNVLFASDVPYGPYEDNVFDLFLVDAAEPTPLVIYLHGGGFTDGDKRVIYVNGRTEIREFLAMGVSVVTINYRLIDEIDTEGVIKSLSDSRRCLQFLRYHHEQLNVDPSRIAVYGSSAGAGTSLWQAFSDNMADPDATDPVLRESTRVSVAGAKATQSTYDLMKWETVVFASLDLTFEDIAGLPGSSEQGLLSFYGVDSLEALATPEMVACRAGIDMLALMSPDDSAFWVQNTVENTGVPADLGELFHHVMHAVALMEKAEIVGTEYRAYIPPLNVADHSGDGEVKFILDRL